MQCMFSECKAVRFISSVIVTSKLDARDGGASACMSDPFQCNDGRQHDLHSEKNQLIPFETSLSLTEHGMMTRTVEDNADVSSETSATES